MTNFLLSQLSCAITVNSFVCILHGGIAQGRLLYMNVCVRAFVFGAFA